MVFKLVVFENTQNCQMLNSETMVQKLFYVLLFVATMLVAMLSFPLIMVGYALLIVYALIKGS